MEDAAANVHRFKLIEVLRVHDFHRSPVRLMPGRMSFHGPVRAITGAQTGSIAGLMQNPETGKIEAVKNRNANVSFNRPLQTNGLNVLDPTSDEWVTADQAVQDYIISLRAFLCARFPSMVEWLPKIELQESPNA